MFSQGMQFLHTRLAVAMKTSVYMYIWVVGSVCIFYFSYVSARYDIVYERLKHIFPLYRYINITLDHNDTSQRSPVCRKPTPHQFVMLWYTRPVRVPAIDPCSSLSNFCECQNCKVTFNTTHIINSDLVIFNHSELPIQAPFHETSSQI